MRWLNRDPIEEESEGNTYNFVKNNSMFAIDVVGLYLELTISPTVREAYKDPKKSGFHTKEDFATYDIAFAEFRPRFDDAVLKLKRCCSKQVLSSNKVCKLIMDPSKKVLVVFEINRHHSPDPKFGNGDGHFRIYNKRTARDGKAVYGIALNGMYNTRTKLPVPLFIYYDEEQQPHRESLETLLFHEVAHYDQRHGGDKRLVFFDNTPDSEDIKRFQLPEEKDAVVNENILRRCCPELKDNHERAYWKFP